jgi:hypothetical protein
MRRAQERKAQERDKAQGMDWIFKSQLMQLNNVVLDRLYMF